MHPRALRNGLLAVLLSLTGTAAADAAPDVANTQVVTQPDGAFVAIKRAEAFLEGNPDDPFPGDGLNTYTYTIQNCDGVIPECAGATSFLPLIGFKVAVPSPAAFSAAGGLGGGNPADAPGGALNGGEVEWFFTGSPINPGETSEKLYITSTYAPGVGAHNIISVNGALNFDASTICIGPQVPPPACDLQLEKTCCVPKPAKPSDTEDICEGKPERMVFEIVGGGCGDTSNHQHGKARCTGHDPIVDPGADLVTVAVTQYASKILVNGQPSPVVVDLAVSNTIEFTSTTGQLLRDTSFQISGPGGSQKLKLSTSCYKPLRCNDQFGAVRLVEVESTVGGTITCNSSGVQTETHCEAPSGGVGTPCDSELTEAVFRFTPRNCQNPLPNPQGGWAECNGNASDAHLPVSVVYAGSRRSKVHITPNAGIQSGDTFRVSATGWSELPDLLKLLIQDDDSVEQTVELKTSCSKPLACGDKFGSLELVGFTTENGTEVDCQAAPPPTFQNACECPVAPPKPHCKGDLEEIQLVYLGELLGANCSVTNDQGGQGSCTGANLTADDVVVTTLTSGVDADPAGGIDARGLFSIKPTNSWQALPSSISFTATDGAANAQTVTIRADCDQPLNLGDRFGDFVVFGMDRGDGDSHNGHYGCDSDDDSDSDSDGASGKPGEDGLITLGCQAEYQYTVTNPNAVAVDVQVVDDPNVADADPSTVDVGSTTLGPGQQHTFFFTRTLYESLTNRATVTGSESGGGAQCTMAMDEVPITVVLPPTGSFDCLKAKPIDEISMKWNGAQDVCVVAYDGLVGGTVLDQQDGIQPGDVVTVDGMGGYPWEQQWQIFAAGDCGGTPLGTSEFKISCHDSAMNGVEDCGKPQGNGKDDDPSLVNDWLLEGLVGDEELQCTPTVVSGGGGGWCGLGFELIFVLPPLLWLNGRKRRRSA
jgi:hypothetical protein